MTQYSPLELNKHIGNGKPWNLNRQNSGYDDSCPLIPQKMAETGIQVRLMQSIKIFILLISMTQNMYLSFQVIIFIKWITQSMSRRIIKKRELMRPFLLIQYPGKKHLGLGFLNTTDDLRIYEFDEKPKKPKSNLASMGIYIFTWVIFKILFIGGCSE